MKYFLIFSLILLGCQKEESTGLERNNYILNHYINLVNKNDLISAYKMLSRENNRDLYFVNFYKGMKDFKYFFSKGYYYSETFHDSNYSFSKGRTYTSQYRFYYYDEITKKSVLRVIIVKGNKYFYRVDYDRVKYIENLPNNNVRNNSYNFNKTNIQLNILNLNIFNDCVIINLYNIKNLAGSNYNDLELSKLIKGNLKLLEKRELDNNDLYIFNNSNFDGLIIEIKGSNENKIIQAYKIELSEIQEIKEFCFCK